MENQITTFTVEETFHITNRGVVLVGETNGSVANGQKLLFDNGICWSIKSVEALYRRNQPIKIGLLMMPLDSSQQELLATIVGATAQVV